MITCQNPAHPHSPHRAGSFCWLQGLEGMGLHHVDPMVGRDMVTNPNVMGQPLSAHPAYGSPSSQYPTNPRGYPLSGAGYDPLTPRQGYEQTPGETTMPTGETTIPGQYRPPPPWMTESPEIRPTPPAADDITLDDMPPGQMRAVFETTSGPRTVTAHLVWLVTFDPDDLTDPLSEGCLDREWTQDDDPVEALALMQAMIRRNTSPADRMKMRGDEPTRTATSTQSAEPRICPSCGEHRLDH